MADVRSLYQASILEHSKRPRNFGKLDGPSRNVSRENSLCGDQVTLYLRVERGRIVDIAFEGEGCALAVASASMMSEIVKGKTVAEVEALSARFAALVRGTEEGDALGPLAVFAPVAEFPARVECVRLAWHALTTVLEGAA
jgi:nitrogen fixation protein NifU and related proteins